MCSACNESRRSSINSATLFGRGNLASSCSALCLSACCAFLDPRLCRLVLRSVTLPRVVRSRPNGNPDLRGRSFFFSWPSDCDGAAASRGAPETPPCSPGAWAVTPSTPAGAPSFPERVADLFLRGGGGGGDDDDEVVSSAPAVAVEPPLCVGAEFDFRGGGKGLSLPS